MPIACVDFVPVDEERSRYGLISRRSPYGTVWCHLGGRVLRDETVHDALQRHSVETLATRLHLDRDPQPAYVFQWFSPDSHRHEEGEYGQDPRQHSIGLSYLVELAGTPHAQGEALEFRWFDKHETPNQLWPGCQRLLERLLGGRLS